MLVYKIQFPKTYCILFSEDQICLSNSTDSHKMLHYGAFNLGLHCQCSHLGISGLQRVRANILHLNPIVALN